MSETTKMNNLILNGQNIDLSPDYQNIRNKPKINGVTVDGNKTLDDFGLATKQSVEDVSKKVDKLPYGMYYGQYDNVESLPSVDQLTGKGYAYVATTEPNIFYIYIYNGEGDPWQDSGNKFDAGTLESNLSSKSKTKAPTTKAVKEGIEAVDITSARSSEDDNELTKVQKYNVSANINDRSADVVPVTGKVKALGYKVLNPALSFAEQVESTQTVDNSNMVFEIRDEFDLEGEDITINCDVEFNRTIGNDVEKTNMYINSTAGITLSAGQKLSYEKGFYIVKEIETDDWRIISDSGVYQCQEDETVYIAQYGNSVKATYKVDEGTLNEINIPISGTGYQKISIKTLYYGAFINVADGESISLKGNQYLFDNNNVLLATGKVYTFNESATIKIAMKFAGTTSYFKATKIDIPENVTLNFNGGKIKNGIINSNRVYIKTVNECFDNVYFTSNSTFKNDELRCSYFFNEGEEVSDILSNLFTTRVKLVKDDLHVLYAKHPIVINGHSKSFVGIKSCLAQSFTSNTSSDVSMIYADDNVWDAKGYDYNALLLVKETQSEGLISNITFYGSKNSVIYNNNFPLKVDYGIATGVFSGNITECKLEFFAVSSLYLRATERTTVSDCRVSYCGAFLLATPNKINKYNITTVLYGTSNSSGNPISLFRVTGNYIFKCNYGVVVLPGSDVHIEKNSLSYTSASAIYVLNTYQTLTIHKNYFEGTGSGAFWIDENGWEGYVNYEQLCQHYTNPHRNEDGKWIESGWGLYVGSGTSGRLVRTVISFISASTTLGAKVTIEDNVFSFNSLRSSINGGLNYSSTAVGLDGVVFISSESTIVKSSGITTNTSRAPYYYIVHDFKGLGAIPTDITIVDLPPVYVNSEHYNWLLTRGCFGADDAKIKLLSSTRNTSNLTPKDIFTKVRTAFFASIPTSVLKNINAITEFYTQKNGRKYYRMPVHNGNIHGIAFNLPYSLLNDGPVIIEMNLLNEDSTDLTFNCGLAYFKGSTGTLLDTKYFGNKLYTVSKNGGDAKRYFFLSQDLFLDVEGTIDSIQLQISYNDAASDVFFSLPYMRNIDGEIDTDISFEDLDEYGYLKYGTTSERPTISSYITKPITYLDTTLGKPTYWFGTHWVDGTGEAVGLQVSDTSVLISAAADSTKDVSVYYGGSTAPIISILNSDDTPCTWLTGTPDPFTGDTLTLTATANTDSNPRGCKVVVTLGNEEKIINVVQNYLTT